MSTVHPIPARTDAGSGRRTPTLPAGVGLLITDQAAEYLGLKPKTLVKDRCTREIGIPFVKLGKSVRYRMADLERFVAERVVA
jgi:excisionase family DNA binding protein